MVLLRVSQSSLIILFCGIIYVNCELEEYFKWKQITYVSVERGNFFMFVLFFLDLVYLNHLPLHEFF